MNRTNVASMAGLALAACVLVATVTACGPPVVGQPGPGSTTDGGATSCEGDSSRSCGRCGVERRSCLDGRWTEWSVCQDEQECSPGATQACAGGGTQTCLMNCTWDTCQGCQGPSMMLCGNCGQQSRTCSGGQLSTRLQPASRSGTTTVRVGFRILAVSAMNQTPQNTITSP